MKNKFLTCEKNSSFILMFNFNTKRERWNVAGGGVLTCQGIQGCATQMGGLAFHQKSLDEGPILVKEILTKGSHFTKIASNGKISRFGGRKTLRMGPNSRNLKKNR